MADNEELAWTSDRAEQKLIEREALGFALRSPATVAMAVFVVALGLFDALVASLSVGLFMVVLFAALYLGLTWMRVRRQVLLGFPVGMRIGVRYGAESFTLHANDQEATVGYAELGTPRVGDHLVSWTGRHTRIASLPRALAPDEALGWIASRRGPGAPPSDLA